MRTAAVSSSILLVLVSCSAPASRAPESSAAAALASTSPTGTRAGALEIGDPYYPGMGNGGYDAEHYRLDLDVDFTSDELSAHAAVRARALQDLASFALDLYGLDVTAVSVDGASATFERAGLVESSDGKPPVATELVVRPAAPLSSGIVFEVQVDYHGWPDGRPDRSVPMRVGWRAAESGVFVASECAGASSWYPCNDHPSDKATYEFHVTVDEPYVVAANGILVDEQDLGDRRTFVWKARDPMASYLATVNIAQFGRLVLEHPRGLPVVIYHPLDATEEELAPFRQQVEILDFLESQFGPYPFESAGGVLAYEQIGGALECQTTPVYSRGIKDAEMGHAVLQHELAHQWFGDTVSPALWRDMWLNEGFASFAEALWVEHQQGAEAYEQRARDTYRMLRQRKVGSPFDPGVERVFSSRVYVRGAFVLYGLRREIGPEKFHELQTTWVARHRDANASTADFVALASEVAGRDLGPFFDAWLYSDVTPEIAEFGPVEELPEGDAPR